LGSGAGWARGSGEEASAGAGAKAGAGGKASEGAKSWEGPIAAYKVGAVNAGAEIPGTEMIFVCVSIRTASTGAPNEGAAVNAASSPVSNSRLMLS
jgi:hypothetical protein